MNTRSSSAASFALFPQNYQAHTQKGFYSDVQFDLNKTLNLLSFVTDSSSKEKFCENKKGAIRLLVCNQKFLFSDLDSERAAQSAFEFLGTKYNTILNTVKRCVLIRFLESKVNESILNLNSKRRLQNVTTSLTTAPAH